MRIRTTIVALGAVACACMLALWAPQAQTQEVKPVSAAAAPARLQTGETIAMMPGRVQTISAQRVNRVAVGSPDIADVTIVSPSEIMLQARRPGTTNLLIWDQIGKRELNISVIDDAEPARLRDEIERILRSSDEFRGVQVQLEGNKVYVTGYVENEDDLEALEKLTAGFSDAVVTAVKVSKEPFELAPLVQLAVRVIELARTDLDSLGVDWSDSVSLTEDDMANSSVKDQLMRVGRSTDRSELTAILTALVQNDKARILSEPRLVTASGKEARSFVGVEIPYLKTSSIGTTTGVSSVTVEYREVGVLLKMTPSVHTQYAHQAGKITTVMEAEISEVNTIDGLDVPVGSSIVLVPAFDVRKANTEVTTTSGDTIFIAGLIQSKDTENVEGVPGLSKIPVLGRLFRTPTLTNEKTELVITVSPELVPDSGKERAYRQAVEQARSGATARVVAPSDSQDPRLGYAMEIQKRIAQAALYPDKAKSLNQEGKVKLRLHLLADGNLSEVILAESSGNEELDLAAVKAARDIAPYPAFPNTLQETELWLDVPVAFGR